MCQACPVLDWAEQMPTIRAFLPWKVDAAMTDYIVWYDRFVDEHKPLVGGKNSSLGQMMMAQLPVPPGFAVTINAYVKIWADPDLAHDVNDLLRQIDHDAFGANLIVADKIRARIEQAPVPDDVAADVREAYAALCEHCGVDDVPVAVRSSATAEDLPDASFAGQQDTFLWIRGAESVIHHMRRCWSSLFTDRAIAYRHGRGYLHQSIAMSVGVQKMVDPIAAGVAFTLNPTNGDRSQIAIDASWGLGEAVVSGEVTPDNYLIDKVIHEIVRREVSDKQFEYRVTDDGTVAKVAVDEARRLIPCLPDEDLKAIAILARRAEKHYGCPQDVEWAIDRHLPTGENVVMLQSRPETVWSQKPVVPLAKAGETGISSIVSTLLAPMHHEN